MPSAETKHSNRKSGRNKLFDHSTREMGVDPLANANEVLQNRLYYAAYSTDPRTPNSNIANYTTVTTDDRETGERVSVKRRVHYFSIDSELVYWNFFLDFGPLNLGQLYRFSQKLKSKMEDPRFKNRVLCFYSNTSYDKRANAVFLISAWQVIFLGRTPDESCSAFMNIISPDYYAEQRQSGRPTNLHGESELGPLPSFHDASPSECTYDLTILDCVRGLAKALKYDFFNFDDFPITEYEHFEQVENGDLTWIMRDKIIAFAGPQNQRLVTREGCYTLTPSDYIPYFQSKNVGMVVRLNKKLYEENEFRHVGIEHVEHYYLDGSCPTMAILQQVLKDFESVPANKAFAVHCKAGLGRTGTCIGAYIMKHFKFTAAEVIGWMRICRPGMVIGPQQNFLEDLQERMWYEGEIMRARPGKNRMMRTKRLTADLDEEDEINTKGTMFKTDLGLGPGLESLSMQETLRLKHGNDVVMGRVGQADELLSRRSQQASSQIGRR